MRSALLLLLLAQLCTAVARASEQDSLRAEQWKRGYVITNANDTLYGSLRIHKNFIYNYLYELAFRSKGMDIENYKPKHLKGFVYYDSARYHLDTLVYKTLLNTYGKEVDEWGDGHYFLRLVVDGKCKVYGTTALPPSSAVTGAMLGIVGALIVASAEINNDGEYYFLQRNGSDLYALRNSFKKDMQEFFWNCPTLFQKIKDKVYTIDNWRYMVKDFNTNGCK